MRFPLFVFCLSLLFFSCAIKSSAQTAGQLFTVNSVVDSMDAVPGDGLCADAVGQCTLRAAIQESNSTPSNRDVVVFDLPESSVIDLTLGELVITGGIAIVGPDARRLTVQRSSSPGTPDFRIFRIASPGLLAFVEIQRMRILNGSTDQNGGGIYVEQGNLALRDAAVTSNRAASGGGIANGGVLSLTRCLVNSNIADNKGGGIFSSANSGGMQIFDSTITNNAATDGGAIYNNFGLLLVNDTITSNTASGTAQSIANMPEGFARSLNTIIGNDQPSSVTSLGGSFFSLGNNIITDARGSTGFNNGVNHDQVSDSNAIDPLLGDLADNGGQTNTRTLLSGSPAIDNGNSCVQTGNCPGTSSRLRYDQRTGHGRVLGVSADIGAIESGSSSITVIASFGIPIVSDGSFYGGSIAVLTDPTNNTKTYKAVNPFGQIVFQNVSGDIHILELKTKRSRVAFSPLVINLSDSQPTSFEQVSISAANFVTDGNKH